MLKERKALDRNSSLSNLIPFALAIFLYKVSSSILRHSTLILSLLNGSIWQFFGKDLISVALSVFVLRYGNKEQSVEGHFDTSPC